MDKSEARVILEAELAAYRPRSYADLVSLIGQPKRSFEVTGASGTIYYIDIRVGWDAGPGGAVRVFGYVDDGGWRAYLPLSWDFIKSPDGSFVGE